MNQARQQVRIGDAERDQTLGCLADHFAAGRLDKEEFEQRSGDALMAKTHGELVLCLQDLPGHRRGATPEDDPVKRNAMLMAMAVCSALLALVVGWNITNEPSPSNYSPCDYITQDC